MNIFQFERFNLKAIEKIEKLRQWRKKLILGLAENICRPCSSAVKNTVLLDYENPLSCGCHCEIAHNILSKISLIDNDINNLNKKHSPKV